ncbi:MAG: methionyl-tRNA formyltransferase, partial [Methylobacteriaceae bacterium]|nr:methionyl-tRNA formyltransferase [Methylobacteriaceae bacterium]
EGAGRPGETLEEGVVACGEGALRLVAVQRAGRGVATGAEFWRGARLSRGMMLT